MSRGLHIRYVNPQETQMNQGVTRMNPAVSFFRSISKALLVFIAAAAVLAQTPAAPSRKALPKAGGNPASVKPAPANPAPAEPAPSSAAPAASNVAASKGFS